MQVITITGNVGKDAETRNVKDTSVTSFSVGVKNGFGRDAGSVWYRCSLWGKAGEAFADSLKKGVKVTINGDLIHDEYEGKPQFNIRVNGIDTAPRSGGNQAADTPAQGGNFDADLDDDVPF